MDLKDGQSFAIAGLDDNRVIQTFEKIPGLGDIPLLGKLFQSRALTKSKTELLVVVTPRIVTPNEPGHAPAGPFFPKSFMEPAAPERASNAKPNQTTN
jgi:pilus assembly protein CpaC